MAWIRARLGEGIAPAEIAVLVRMNAQLAPIEEALTRAGVAYQVRGLRFYDRPEVRAALASLRRAARSRPWARPPGRRSGPAGPRPWATRRTGPPRATRRGSARPRFETLLAIVDGIAVANPAADAASVIADLEARAAHEREGAAGGVNLLTYHRAKGLEWDAVFLPSLEEGILPIRQAKDDDEALAEERRLLYVGITRARVHLALSWAERRETRGREARRQPSRFLLDLRPRAGHAGHAPAPGRRHAERGRGGAATRTTRCSRRSAPGAPRGPARRRCRPTSSPTTPRSRRSRRRARGRMAGLRRVKGMGPAKLEKYGDEMLAVIEAALGA